MHRDELLQRIDSAHENLSIDADLGDVRNIFLNLIEDCLKKVQDSFGYWEKLFLADAIASFAWNLNSQNQPTTSWLKLCLVNLEKALVPVDERDENYVPKDIRLDSLTYEHLMDDVKTIRSKCS